MIKSQKWKELLCQQSEDRRKQENDQRVSTYEQSPFPHLSFYIFKAEKANAHDQINHDRTRNRRPTEILRICCHKDYRQYRQGRWPDYLKKGQPTLPDYYSYKEITGRIKGYNMEIIGTKIKTKSKDYQTG